MITQLPQYVPSLKSLKIEPGKRTIITDSLESADIHIPENTELEVITLLEKGWDDTQKLNFHIEGEGSTVNFYAFIVAKGEQKFPFETTSHHRVPHTSAYYHIRAVQFDKSNVDYLGNIIIRPEAQQTDAYLGHYTLMMSDRARTKTIPSLEIEADDVKAGHAATVGRTDEDMLFYLQSRGLNKKEATEMLIQGFLQADLSNIKNKELKQAITEELLCLIPNK